jgi:hypothetical protein
VVLTWRGCPGNGAEEECCYEVGFGRGDRTRCREINKLMSPPRTVVTPCKHPRWFRRRFFNPRRGRVSRSADDGPENPMKRKKTPRRRSGEGDDGA